MKTIVLPLLAAAMLQTLAAQNYIASATGVPPTIVASESGERMSSKLTIAAYPYTVDDMAEIRLGKGLRKAVNLQVLTPNTELLINKAIPAGQSRVLIDLAGLPNGTYTMRINLGDQVWVKQVVKQ